MISTARVEKPAETSWQSLKSSRSKWPYKTNSRW